MAALPAAVLPLAALASLGGAAISGGLSLIAQNSISRGMHPDIPRYATPYNSWFARIGGTPHTNSTIFGFITWASVFGMTFVGGRLAINPLTKALRKKFIFHSGTNTPKRIKSFKGLLYDLCPDVIVNTLPVIPAFQIAMFAKVMADGPGRFKDWGHQYNPYDSVVQRREEVYGRPGLPTYLLHKVEETDVKMARSLFEKRELTLDEKITDLKKLQHW